LVKSVKNSRKKSEKTKVLFVGEIPLFLPERNIARQVNIELWLSTALIEKTLKQVNAQPISKEEPKSILEKTRGYIV